MAYQSTGMFNDDGRPLWYDQETGNYTDTDPFAGADPNAIFYQTQSAQGYGGENPSGLDIFTLLGQGGSYSGTTNVAPTEANVFQGPGDHLDFSNDYWKNKYQNPGDTYWGQAAQDIFNEGGIYGLGQAANTGYFNQFSNPQNQNINEALGPFIAQGQASQDFGGDNLLNFIKTALMMYAGGAAGGQMAGASGGTAGAGAGAGTGAGVTALEGLGEGAAMMGGMGSGVGGGTAALSAPAMGGGLAALGSGAVGLSSLGGGAEQPLQFAQAGTPDVTPIDIQSPTGGFQMPQALPAQDPTFGGALTQTGPGSFENIPNISSFGSTDQGAQWGNTSTFPQPQNYEQAKLLADQGNQGWSNLDPVAMSDDLGGGAMDQFGSENSPLGEGGPGTVFDNPLGGFDWNSIPQEIRNLIPGVLKGALAPGAGQEPGTTQGGGSSENPGTNWLGMGMDLYQLSGQRDFQKGLLDTMNRAVDKSDPFASERPFYQQQFRNMQTDPNWMQNDSVLNNISNDALRRVSAQNAAKGYLNSGNILHDLTRTATETNANYALPRMQMAGQAAGAFNDPSRTGGIMAQMAPIAGLAGLAQNQTLGNMVGRLGQGNMNGINNMISNGLRGIFGGGSSSLT